MSTQEHKLVIDNDDIIKQVEIRTFKFGKAHEGLGDKIVNDMKLTDLGYDRSIVIGWIDVAVGNIRSAFVKYAGEVETAGEGEQKRHRITFTLSSKWASDNAQGFDNDCREYVINHVVYDFLSLSLPKEAEFYNQKSLQSLKDAERKLYYKTA